MGRAAVGWAFVHVHGWGLGKGVAAGVFANWLAGICIYSMQQNVTTGLGGDLCGLSAKQTDEGNLSCGSRFAEEG